MGSHDLSEIAARTLSTSAHFGPLSAPARRRLLGLCHLETYESRRTLQGKARAMWIIIEGALTITYAVAGAERVPIGVLGPGSHFNATALHGVPAMRMTAQTASQTTCAVLREREIVHVREHDDELREFIAKLAVARMTAMIHLYRDLLDAQLPTRLARRLLAQAPAHELGEGRAVELPLTQAVLAKMLRSNRVQLNRALKTMERDGALTVGYGRIRLLDWKRLERVAGSAIRRL